VTDPLIFTYSDGLHPLLREWSGGDLQKRLGEQLAVERSRCTDLAFGQRFARAIRLEGATAQDYLQQVHVVGPHTVLVGIRFKGLDPSEPFVDLLASSAPWSEVGDALLRLRDQLYPRFAPKWLRVYLPEGEPEAAERVADLRHLAAPLHTLQQRDRPPGFDALELVAAQDLAWRDDYDALYRSLMREAPELRDEVQPSTAADLTDCLRAEQLWLAQQSGQWVGVVGARPEQDGPLWGWCVVEEILRSAVRGQGLGPVLQRHLIEQLPAEGLLHGTIHPVNVASYRTALRCGRRDVGGWWFVR
jgi:GNAT superfamily N-acetyltransferase